MHSETILKRYMAITSTDSQTISFLRFPLTFAVVMQHSMGTIRTQIDWSALSAMDFYTLLKSACSGCIALVAVPIFFFISGYLFFVNVDHMDGQVYKEKMHKRLWSLVVPSFLWNVLCIPIMLLVKYGETFSGTTTMAEFTDFIQHARWWHVFWDFTSHDAAYDNLLGWPVLKESPVLSTFWYIRDLIVISALSPLVYWFVRKLRWMGVSLLMGCYILKLWPHVTIGTSCLFFVFGAYWSLNRFHLYIGHRWLRRGIYLLSALLLLVMIRLLGNDTYWGTQIAPIFTLIGCFCVLSMASSFCQHKPSFCFPPLLTKSSFFVYALHIELGLPLAFFLLKAAFRGAYHPLLLSLQYLLTPCLIYIVCLLVYVCLQKMAPRFLVVLNGSR